MSREHDLLLAALAGLLPEQRPADAAGLRDRLLARATAPRTRVLRADEGEWVPFFPGIRIKTLRRDEREGTQTTLWRLEPRAVVPPMKSTPTGPALPRAKNDSWALRKAPVVSFFSIAADGSALG